MQGISSGHLLTGVYGIQTTNDGTGVAGRSYKDSSQRPLGAGIGVWGDSGSGPGLKGTSDSGNGLVSSSNSGRGGVFSGGVAQIWLAPSPTAATHPAAGKAGDLFVDKSNRLWYCQGGTHWRQLA